MNGTFAYVAIGVAIAEWMAFYNCPVLLARLAVVPAGTRYLDVPPRARAALTSDNPPGAYRTTEPTSFDLARLVGPTLIEQPEATMYFARNAARAVGVTPLGLVGRTRSLVRVDLSGSEGRVALHARCYPAGLLPLVIGLLGWGIAMVNAGPVVAAVVLGAILVAADLHAARRRIDLITAEVSARLRSLDR